MTDSCDSSDFPDWVTFFIGPPGAPPERVEAYAGAVELAEAGNREALDEFLQIETDALKGMEDSVEKDRSPLCDMVAGQPGFRSRLIRNHRHPIGTPYRVIQGVYGVRTKQDTKNH